MGKITVTIEAFIKDRIEETDNGVLEIGRNDLADKFGCAPSQINYVLSTRFTPYKGYYIESRRGGGGYIKIIKVSMEDEWFGDLIVETIGDKITKNKAYTIIDTFLDKEMIDKRGANLMKAAIEDTALGKIAIDDRNYIRADILKNMLLITMK